MTASTPPSEGYETKAMPGYVPAATADNHENTVDPGYTNDNGRKAPTSEPEGDTAESETGEKTTGAKTTGTRGGSKPAAKS